MSGQGRIRARVLGCARLLIDQRGEGVWCRKVFDGDQPAPTFGLIGLKGFVGAIIGGLASYPLAAVGAVLVGLLESYSSFWASAYKEVIVFSTILPVLLWRSLRDPHGEEH